jgi:hypothetical protein
VHDEDVQVIHLHFHRGADEARVAALEDEQVTIVEDLTALTATVTEFNEDVAARVAALEAAQGTFTPEQQVAFDALQATVLAGVAGIGDADGDGNPA